MLVSIHRNVLKKQTIMHIAKLFENGRSQAVRLPKDFRMTGKEMSVSLIGQGVLLQPTKRSWRDVYQSIKPDPDFMNEREDFPSQEREDF
jgi:antitoxin VapB